MTRNKILYFILPIILVFGIYGCQTSYEKSDYFQPYNIKKSNTIMTISIDNSAYTQGQKINIYGKINHYTEGVPIVMKIISPTKTIVSEFNALTGRSGIFTQFFDIPDTFSSGKYTLNAYYAGDLQKTLLSFDINISTTPNGYYYILIPFGASTEDNKLNFVPSKLVVPAESKITWVNNDGTVHTVLSGKVNDDGTLYQDERFIGGYISPGQNLEISLYPGSYTYFCKLHPWLGGTITVEPIPVKDKPVAPVTKPVAPVTKPVAPVTKPVAPVTKPVAPVTKPVVTGAAESTSSTNSTPANSTISNTNTNPSTGSDNFLSAIWKSLLSLFTGSALQHNDTTGTPTSEPVKPTTPITVKPTPPVTKPTPSVKPIPENNTPKYYDKFSSLNNWKIISGNWKASTDGLHGGSLLGNANQIILSPISSKNFTLDTSFRIIDANQTLPNYVTIIYSWTDTKNYETVQIAFFSHQVYVSYINVREGKTFNDPAWPGKVTGLSGTLGNLFNITFSKQGQFEDLFLNGTKYLHREYVGNSGYIGLGTGRVHDVVIKDIIIK